MIIQIVKLKTNLAQDELERRAREREPRFKALEGLVQKYYTKLQEPGQYAGIYVWDSIESLKKFRESELAASIPGAYELSETPDIEIMDVLFQLRD